MNFNVVWRIVFHLISQDDVQSKVTWLDEQVISNCNEWLVNQSQSIGYSYWNVTCILYSSLIVFWMNKNKDHIWNWCFNIIHHFHYLVKHWQFGEYSFYFWGNVILFRLIKQENGLLCNIQWSEFGCFLSFVDNPTFSFKLIQCFITDVLQEILDLFRLFGLSHNQFIVLNWKWNPYAVDVWEFRHEIPELVIGQYLCILFISQIKNVMVCNGSYRNLINDSIINQSDKSLFIIYIMT